MWKFQSRKLVVTMFQEIRNRVSWESNLETLDIQSQLKGDFEKI